MAKADLEMALVKSCGRSPLTPDELLELLNMDIGQLITNHDMDLYQAEEVMKLVDVLEQDDDVQHVFHNLG